MAEAAVDYSDYKNRNYCMAIDTSGSMGWEMGPNNKRTRVTACQEAAVEVADEATNYDADGIKVYTFSGRGKHTCTDNVTGDKVAEVFEKDKPRGGTYLRDTLRDCFSDYLNRRKEAEDKGKTIPGETMIIFTDGAAKDNDEVALEIASFTHQLRDPQEFRIGFVLTLDSDSDDYPEVDEFMDYLDDTLTKKGVRDPQTGKKIKAKYDIVDRKDLSWVEKHSTDKFFQQVMTD